MDRRVLSRKYNVLEHTLLQNEEIRDTSVHVSNIVNIAQHKIMTVYVNNGLDRDVQVQVKANRNSSTVGAVDIGVSFTVSADDVQARTLTPQNEGFLPYIFIEVTAVAAPASGSISAYVIGRN